MPSRPLAVALVLLAALAAPGCYQPTAGRCQVACVDGCPAGLTCGVDQFCHGADDPPTCGLADGPAPDATADDGPPPDAASLPAVDDLSAGNRHVCAIREGRLTCWGDNRHGQLGQQVLPTTRRIARPTYVDARTWTAVAAGQNHTCGIEAGHVWCWGSSQSGQAGQSMGSSSARTEIRDGAGTALTGATAVCAGDGHSCAIAGGTLYCWGSDLFGQLGDGPTGDGQIRSRAAPVSTMAPRQWTDVACGAALTCGVSAGQIYCWGGQGSGELGRPVTGDDYDEPTDTAVLADAAEVVAGDTYACARTTVGGVSCWGYFNDVLHGAPVDTRPPGLGTVTLLAAARDGACMSDGTTTRCFGDGSDGELGDGAFAYRRGFGGQVVDLGPINRLTTGTRFHCAVTADNRIACWGKNSDGQLGRGSHATGYLPRLVTHVAHWRKVAAGDGATCGLDTNREVYCWGRGDVVPGLDQPGTDVPQRIGAELWDDVAVGSGHACAVRTTGGNAVACWGTGAYGRVGDGTEETAPHGPVTLTLPGTPLVAQVATGAHTTAAVSPSAMYGWGDDADSRLGLPLNGHYLQPTAIISGDWRQVALGYDFGCGIGATGQVWCWGADARGQQGNAGAGTAAVPATLPGLTASRLAIGATGQHACAVVGTAATGAIRCWGRSDSGQAGTGAASAESPTMVGAATTWDHVAVGVDVSCALASGQLACWGADDVDRQQFGTDSPDGTSRFTPLNLQVGTVFSDVAVGVGHTCAIRGDGTLYCWGESRFGESGVAGARYYATAADTLPPT
ncbi:MAG: hypothetical protein IPH80_28990 [Myxococcales bacterium]|nr:hypothetical protein [Myxococcales bacterium]